MSVGQGQFDADLTALTTAITGLTTAINAYIAAVQNAAPNLATEDGEVKTALAGVQAAQAAVAAAAP